MMHELNFMLGGSSRSRWKIRFLIKNKFQLFSFHLLSDDSQLDTNLPLIENELKKIHIACIIQLSKLETFNSKPRIPVSESVIVIADDVVEAVRHRTIWFTVLWFQSLELYFILRKSWNLHVVRWLLPISDLNPLCHFSSSVCCCSSWSCHFCKRGLLAVEFR